MSLIELIRFSQKALPIAKGYDSDGNGSLDDAEYKKFIDKWNKDYPGKSPMLMQLHMKTLSPKAFHIAQNCDGLDGYKGVLTNLELKAFMDECEKANVEFPFKDGVNLKTVLTGEDAPTLNSVRNIKNRPNNIFSGIMVRKKLLENWLKLDLMNYKGSDKFFHAVGNYEAMKYGNEKIVKQICAGQDADKRKESPRAEEEYTDDLYANFLGREFAKMYPYNSPHEMMEPLAPAGFDIQKSKEDVFKLFSNSDKSMSSKVKQYIGYLKEKYVIKRFFTEVCNTLFNK